MKQISPTQNVNAPPNPCFTWGIISFKTEVGQSYNGFPCLYTALLPHKATKKLHIFCTSSKQWILNSVATYNGHSLWHRIINICIDCVTTVWKNGDYLTVSSINTCQADQEQIRHSTPVTLNTFQNGLTWWYYLMLSLTV